MHVLVVGHWVVEVEVDSDAFVHDKDVGAAGLDDVFAELLHHRDPAARGFGPRATRAVELLDWDVLAIMWCGMGGGNSYQILEADPRRCRGV